MTDHPDRPSKPSRPSREAVDGKRDFYFDELMTPQPDATREFFRSRLAKPVKPRDDTKS
jgi:hypothetical protein